MVIPKTITCSYDVAGFNSLKHLNNLGEFAKKIPEKSRVLEVGVGFGGSTWELMDSLPADCKLHSCDTFLMNSAALKSKHISGVLKKHSSNSAIVYQMNVYKEWDQRAAFDWAVKQHPRYREIMKEVYSCKSIEVLQKDNNWDMVYLDGHHSYETVSTELSYLDDVPYVCGDDYHPAHPGCQKAIEEWIDRTGRNFKFDPFVSGSGFWVSTLENV